MINFADFIDYEQELSHQLHQAINYAVIDLNREDSITAGQVAERAYEIVACCNNQRLAAVQ